MDSSYMRANPYLEHTILSYLPMLCHLNYCTYQNVDLPMWKKKKKVWILKSNTLKCQIATKFISPFQRLRLKCCSNKFMLEWFKWFRNSRLFRFYSCMYTMFALKVLCTFIIYPEIVGRPSLMKLIILFLFHYVWTLVWLC